MTAAPLPELRDAPQGPTVVQLSKPARRRAPFWFPLNVDEWESKTFDLSTLEVGGYAKLMVGYWRAQAPLQDDDALLARLAGVEQRTWRTLRPVLERKFDVGNGVWIDTRMNEQIAAARHQAEVNRKNRIGRGAC